MFPERTSFLDSAARYGVALIISLLLISTLAVNLYADTPAPAYIDLDATQLDQLVAPIALDPDSLVAQILTASTYPDQVSEADNWLKQNMDITPDERADAADKMSWDPSVKGLTAFPAVLDNLAKNTAWTAQLGNAYFNQPGDVMNAIQAMRLQAQQSNLLVTTAQERVVVEDGAIEIVPVNPAVVYVPYYNPWKIWGALFVAYPGFVLLPPPAGVVATLGIAFEPAIPVGIYSGFDWGYSAWAPGWASGSVVYNNYTYISNSTTVYNHGHFGCRDRGVFEHGGRGIPRGYHFCAHAGAAREAGLRNPYRGHGALTAHNGPRGPVHNNPVHAPVHNAPLHTAHGPSAGDHGKQTASRQASAANHTSPYDSHATSATNHSAPNHSTSTANHGTANSRQNTSSNHSATNHGVNNTGSHNSANHSPATTSRGTTNTNRGASANRGISSASNHGASSAGRTPSAANHSAPAVNRSPSMATHATPAAAHSGGGHAAPSRGRGR